MTRSLLPAGEPVPLPPDRGLVRSLVSTACPACDRRKVSGQTLCVVCYRRLPRAAQVDLYRRLGHGYREAVERAFQILSPTGFRLPGGGS